MPHLLYIGASPHVARSSRTGDGKIYVAEVADAVRISNSERGPGAV